MSSIRCIISLLVLAIAAVMMPVATAYGSHAKPEGRTPPPPSDQKARNAAKKRAAHNIGKPLPEYAAKCGEVLPGTDINVGEGNLEPVGSLTTDDGDCINLCDHTPTCNAAIRVADGRCYLKHVNVGVDIPVRAPGMNLYMRC